ncbi:dienelactone hydrolase family protein [Bradyrhizobium sp. NBAIM03]|uniref:alpha/beta hydrolase family protein n=1 Tax=unclassified Bradyrhizobium TaxID=2631580 RepID=UPI001CD24487|nr:MULTISPECIES: dienelactone hydrolase family protein [unclassified Bradyrhizobium]MCA1471118.1 dienelactone hydrolase family protein [Bradyrhizobium sp. IC3195]MCA1536800.1 dienelactone hydrolase family protein [Bradyrhizobium sp. NBAIM03]
MMREQAKSVHRSPRYDADGWTHWPDHEVESTQLRRLLGDAQEGASFVSECLMIAGKIVVGDDESWLEEWRALADRIARRARLSSAEGHFTTARNEWLRALNYYRTASAFLVRSDPRIPELSRIANSCAEAFLEVLSPRGEVLEIRFGTNLLQGYLIRSSAAPRKSPVVVAIGEERDTKEDLLVRFQSHAIANGLSLLVTDLPREIERFQDRPVHHYQCVALRRWLDYLLSRDDVDQRRIALIGDGLGGALATRVAATETRWAAAVCDGGFWDDLEHRYVTASLFGPDIKLSPFCKLARQIKCPSLVVVGEHDYVSLEDITALHEHCRAAGVPMDLKIFKGEETGSSHRQLDNPSIGRQFIFDWLRDKLRIDRNDQAPSIPTRKNCVKNARPLALNDTRTASRA